MAGAWKPGRETIAALIDRRHLERISGDAANGTYLLREATRRLSGARAALDADPAGAFALAYDALRQAVTAVLVQQGLRPRSEGGHIAVVEAAQAQFGDVFAPLNSMRRVRNQLEYPRNPSDLDVDRADAQGAISTAQQLIEAVERLMPELGMWQMD
ncbi:HEPN domain-containing protein [Mycolicibacterium goodii]|uniref:HEPN domain-containing protein n=1 Tax=Mycolicibacterium goodii TaxID=134601 RepID=UPI001BDDC4B4|nr:HEPN domain-containing protein [Mycolicibacterium goodii]MBU8820325.1 HEPN domain-containing protein [Mycolicibacterium goodii]